MDKKSLNHQGKQWAHWNLAGRFRVDPFHFERHFASSIATINKPWLIAQGSDHHKQQFAIGVLPPIKRTRMNQAFIQPVLIICILGT